MVTSLEPLDPAITDAVPLSVRFKLTKAVFLVTGTKRVAVHLKMGPPKWGIVNGSLTGMRRTVREPRSVAGSWKPLPLADALGWTAPVGAAPQVS